jgi:hypothetical protein
VRDAVLAATRRVLTPGTGTFLVYQFSPAVGGYLQEVFGAIRRDFEPLNILPAQLFFCTP